MTQTSKEYAEALFSLAAEENMLNDVSKGLNLVLAQLRGNPEYVDFLASPNIPIVDRLKAIDEAFADSVCEYVISFLKILCEKGSVRNVYKIILDFEGLYQASQGIATARVISAVSLKKAEKEKLQHKLEKMCGKKVVMECIVSKAILGGMIVYIDGKVLDGSLKRRLHDIKEVIENES